jgi:S1-C subfamily serine protease
MGVQLPVFFGGGNLNAIKSYMLVVLTLISPAFCLQKKPARKQEKPLPEITFAQVVKKLRPSIVQIVVPQVGSASGFWVSETGYVLTCWHVVRDNPRATFKVPSRYGVLF